MSASWGSVELFGKTSLSCRPESGPSSASPGRTSSRACSWPQRGGQHLPSVIGVAGGRLRPVLLPGRDRGIRERAREPRVASRSITSCRRPSGRSRMASTGRWRSRWRSLRSRRALMLDEPAAGLSRGERQLLTDLLLALDPAITLILIEHDMDIALRVAGRVTMMHDGRVIVEGHAGRRFAGTRRARSLSGRGYRDERDPGRGDAATPFLEVEGLDAFYGSAHVLQDVSFPWVGSRWRSSAATAWARRRSARPSWASRRLEPAARSSSRVTSSSASRRTRLRARVSATCLRAGASSRR